MEFINKYRSYLMGIAIIWVVLYHFYFFPSFLGIKDVYPLKLLFSTGYLGVDIFLFLSSYGLCYSWTKNNIKTFYANRFRRIYPMYLLYLLAIIILFPISVKDSYSAFVLYQITGWELIRQSRTEWYIPSLTILYAIFPVLFKVAEKVNKRKIWEILTIVALIFLLRYVSWVPFDHYLMDRLPVILLGIFTYQNRKDASRRLLLVGVGLISVAIFNSERQIINSIAVVSAIIILDYCYSKKSFMIPEIGGGITICGKCSLEIYLGQNLAFAFFSSTGMELYSRIGVTLCIVIVASIVLHYFQYFAERMLFSKK